MRAALAARGVGTAAESQRVLGLAKSLSMSFMKGQLSGTDCKHAWGPATAMWSQCAAGGLHPRGCRACLFVRFRQC
eukprot:COSAG01_NODE_60_length_29981_cov_23.262533_17_plen_76_part_00